MALDEALLECRSREPWPVLRFYSWTRPAASFGFFQRYADVEQLTSLRPLVRRPTGGGIVPHDADWTYSLCFPPQHKWYELSAKDSYCRVHEWIQKAFERLAFQTELAPVAVKTQAGQCFVGHEQSDLLWRGRKIAGAAQRRRRDGLLIQGSVQVSSRGIARSAWEKAMLDEAIAGDGVTWKHGLEDTQTRTRALQLTELKYSQSSYNQRR
jgi:lipoate-protein ligase A